MFNESIRSQILGGSLADFKRYMAGIYRGYRIIIEQNQRHYLIKINTQSNVDINNEILHEFLTQFQGQLPQIVDLQIYSFSVVIEVAMSPETHPAELFNMIIDTTVDFLAKGRYISRCETCGSGLHPINCYEINGGHHYICEQCAAQVGVLSSDPEDVPSKRRVSASPSRSIDNSFFIGLGGAAAGAFIGCALWVLLYQFGFLGGVAGIAVAVLSVKCFEMLNGSLDKLGFLGSVIISVILMFIANRIAWTLGIHEALVDQGYSFSEVFRSFGTQLSDAGLTFHYWAELLVGYALYAVSLYPTILEVFQMEGLSAFSLSEKRRRKK